MPTPDTVDQKRVTLTTYNLLFLVEMDLQMNELGEIVTTHIKRCQVGESGSKDQPVIEENRKFIEEHAPEFALAMAGGILHNATEAATNYRERLAKGEHGEPGREP